MEIGTADYPVEPVKPGDAGFRIALDKADAWREAANTLANLHPHEWAVLYAAALKRRGLTN